MNKYYIPKIEEFHVGFEYEINVLESIQDDGKEKRSWVSTYIDDNIHHLFAETKRLKEEPHNIKVKYLDRKDIESLGFKLYNKEINSNDLDYKETFTKNNIGLIYNYNHKTISIFTRDLSKNDLYSEINIDPYLINKIVIKNKSELKKLLQQLKIIK